MGSCLKKSEKSESPKVRLLAALALAVAKNGESGRQLSYNGPKYGKLWKQRVAWFVKRVLNYSDGFKTLRKPGHIFILYTSVPPVHICSAEQYSASQHNNIIIGVYLKTHNFNCTQVFHLYTLTFPKIS